jgi:hypothetical protein
MWVDLELDTGFTSSPVTILRIASTVSGTLRSLAKMKM